MGTQAAKLALKTSGAELSGTIDTSMGNSDFTGVVNGDDVSWSMDIDSPMGRMTVEVKGKVSGNDISGEVKVGNFGNSPFKGKKA
jgi:hypothetical protein